MPSSNMCQSCDQCSTRSLTRNVRTHPEPDQFIIIFFYKKIGCIHGAFIGHYFVNVICIIKKFLVE